MYSIWQRNVSLWTTETVWVRSWFTAHRSCTSLYNETGLISPSAGWDSRQLRHTYCHPCGTRHEPIRQETLTRLVTSSKTDRNFKTPEEEAHKATEGKRTQREFFLPFFSSAFLSPYGSHLSGGGLSDINNRLWKNSRREGDACFLPEGLDLQRPGVLHGKAGRTRAGGREKERDGLKERERGRKCRLLASEAVSASGEFFSRKPETSTFYIQSHFEFLWFLL